MLWLAGLFITAIAAAGLLQGYLNLPRSPNAPEWLLVLLFAAAVLGLILYRKNRKAAWFTTALSLVATWTAVQISYRPVLAYTEELAQNPYTPFNPGTLVRGVFLLEVGAGLFLAFTAGRFIDTRFKNSPLEQEPKLTLLPGKRKKSNLDVVVCRDVKTKKPVVIKEHDRYLHTLVIGPTGCGKTSRVLKPMIWQDLNRLASGTKLSMTVIEPKGEMVTEIAELCEHLGIPHTIIDPLRPDSAHFNPLEGENYQVAETTRTVLKSIFGKQEAFFALVQEVAARNVIMLLKELKGNDLDMVDVVQALQNPDTLSNYVAQLETLKGKTDLTEYFRDELLGRLKDKYMQFAIGIRQQLSDLVGNPLLKPILSGKSSISLDGHLEGGHVLLINTAMGPLGTLGDIFGEFMIMHLENAVFRRPGTEWTRTPHFLYIDEAPRYVNPDMERLLAIGRSYRCATVMAIQSGKQFELAEKTAFKDIAMTNCRHKIVFGGLTAKEAREFELELGIEEKMARQGTYEHRMLIPNLMPKNYRYVKVAEPRFSYTEIMEMDQYRMIYRITRNGSYLPPGIGEGKLVKLLQKRKKPTKPETGKGSKQPTTAPATTPAPGPHETSKGAEVIVFKARNKKQDDLDARPERSEQQPTARNVDDLDASPEIGKEVESTASTADDFWNY